MLLVTVSVLRVCLPVKATYFSYNDNDNNNNNKLKVSTLLIQDKQLLHVKKSISIVYFSLKQTYAEDFLKKPTESSWSLLQSVELSDLIKDFPFSNGPMSCHLKILLLQTIRPMV